MSAVKRIRHRASPRRRSGPAKLLPATIRNSPLMRKGGFEVTRSFLDDEACALMLKEALELWEGAQVWDVPESDGEEVRGGLPARHFASVAGGPVQDGIYQSPAMLEFLGELCNVAVAPTGNRGTYNFYSQTGDYIAIHRDIGACDVTVSTCLYNAPRHNGHGGALCLYPSRLFEPLSVIRSTPDHGATLVSLEPGQTIVVFGGLIPHTLLPVSTGQTRIVSLLCYRAAM